MEATLAVTPIRKVEVRFVRIPPEEAERRRRTLLELQVRSILNAHRAAQEEERDRGEHTETAKENTRCGSTS